jgi:hypothetical protein
VDKVNSINNKVPYNVHDFNLPYKFTCSDCEVRLTNILQVAEREKKVAFFNYHQYLKDRLLVDYIILAIAAPNITHDSGNVYDWCHSVSKECDREAFDAPVVLQFRPSLFFIGRDRHWSFVTCGGRKTSGINFKSFISAFHPVLWGFIAIFYFILGFIVSLVVAKLKIPFYIGFSIFLEQTDNSLTNRKKVSPMLWLVLTWIITGLVISNAYKGQSITEVTAPRKPVGISTFQELWEQNFTLYTNPTYSNVHWTRLRKGFLGNKAERLTSLREAGVDFDNLNEDITYKYAFLFPSE